MKHTFQLSAVAVALAAVTGSAIAAPTPITGLANDTEYGQYDRILGQYESITSTNNKRNEYKADAVDNTTAVSKAANEAMTATVVEVNGTKYLSWSLTDERRAGSKQTKTQSIYDTNIAASEEASVDSKIVWTNNTTQQTGTAVHGGAVLQELQVDAQGNPVKDAQGNYMTVGNKFRDTDSQFGFTADDLTKVGDATKFVNNFTSTNTQYKSGQVLDNTSESSYENVNESNAIAYDTNGKAKQSNGTTDFIVTGTHKNNGTSKTATYQNGKSELASTSESTSDYSETDANYHYDNKGNFAFTDADTDGKNAYNVSNVTSFEEKTSNSYKQYQANQTKVYERANSVSEKETRTDVFDGFVSTDESTSQGSYVVYGTGKHTLSFEQKDSGTSATKSRKFERNTDGTLVLKDGKPVVDTETETKGTNETYESAYQPTRYTKAEAEADAKLKPAEQRGIYEGQAYNQQILNDGVKTAWTDSNVAKTTDKGTTSTVVTHKQDGNFQEHWNTAWDDSATYTRNQQENIEVNRDISNSFTSDSKTLNKAYKVGEVITKAGEDDQFALGTVRVDAEGNQYDGRLVSQGGDVHTWKDETGKDRYYVVIDTDDEDNQVRSEVTYKNGKPAETKDVLVDVVNTTVTADKRTDKVTMGEEVAYSTNSAIKNETATTSRDGKIVYESNKFNESTDKKVYSIGKNALDYQKVVDRTEETVYSNYQLDNANKVVVTSVDTTKNTWKNTTQQYQPGQEKSLVNSSLESWNNTRIAGDKEVAYDRGNAESTFTQYNEGKSALDRTTVSKETGESKAQYQESVSTDIRPVNENGTKINAGGVLAIDEQGQAVVSKATNTVATVDFDKVAKTTDNVDEKVFQTGATAYSKTESQSSDAVLTYADNSTGYEKAANNSDVKLYNHGESDKYRDFTSSDTESSKKNTYELNAKGEAVLNGTVEKSESTNVTEVNYQAGKNALDKSTKTVKATAETTVAAGTTKAVKDAATTDVLVYQEGQELKGAITVVSSGEEKLTNADNTGYTYTTAGKTENKAYNTRMGLLAEQTVASTVKTESTETLAASGKDTVSITRGNTSEMRTDESRTGTTYGSETKTVADGSKTMLSKKETSVTDKFGTMESETLNRTETTIAKDGSSTAMSVTRVDTVDGITLTKEKIVDPSAGSDSNVKAATSTVVASTEIKAGEIKVGDVTLSADKGLDAGQRAVTGVGRGVADTDAANVGQMNESRAQAIASANTYTDSRVNQVSRKLDNVEKTAYRGVAIALAAQQAVPNIQPGQVAVFGGVGHYEGETAASIGVVTSFTNRISASGAFGFSDGSTFGGRVGVSYLFGGN